VAFDQREGICRNERHYDPQGTSGKFRMPYYVAVLKCVRRFYRTGDPSWLQDAAAPIRELESGKDQTKYERNVAALRAFRESKHAARKVLSVLPNPTYKLVFGNLEVKASADMVISEHGVDHPVYLFMDFRRFSGLIHSEEEVSVFRTQVELYSHILSENGVTCPRDYVQYLCFSPRKDFRWKGPATVKTIEKAKKTAKYISYAWHDLSNAS
jgi:hypothetical protein